MLSLEPFRPQPNGTVSATSSGSNATAALNTSLLTNIGCLVYNSGTATAFVEFGGVATVAAQTTSSMPIPGGGWRVVSIDQCTFAAAITAGSTCTVYFTRGYGL